MIEIFDELAVVAEAVADEDKVICLLAGLPDSYDVLVTTRVHQIPYQTWKS